MIHAVLKLDINKEWKNGSQLCFLTIRMIIQDILRNMLSFILHVLFTKHKSLKNINIGFITFNSFIALYIKCTFITHFLLDKQDLGTN